MAIDNIDKTVEMFQCKGAIGELWIKEFHKNINNNLIEKFNDLISDVYNNPKFDKKRTEDFTQFVMLIEEELNKLSVKESKVNMKWNTN